MHMWPRLAAMLVAIILTAAAVVVLKGMLPGNNIAPPAQMPGSSDLADEDPPGLIAQQPTILQAKPAIQDGWASPRGHYQEQLPDDQSSYPEPEWVGPYLSTPLPNARPLDPQTPSLDDPHWQRGSVTGPQIRAIQAPVVSQPQVLPAGENSQTESEVVGIKPVYLTRRNDSLWSISEELYGSGAFYIALYVHNRAKIADPARLASGVTLETPSEAELRRLYPQHCPAK